MKKLIILTTIILFGFINLNAQGVNFGVKAGVNNSTLNDLVESTMLTFGPGDPQYEFLKNFTSRTAFHIGIVVEIMVSDKFAIQPEILYSAQGSDYTGFDLASMDRNEGQGTYKFDYLNVPILAKFYLAEGFGLEVGPQIGLLLSATQEYEEVGEEPRKIKEGIEEIDIGVAGGISYKLKGGLNFGGRYIFGLTKFNDREVGDYELEYNQGVVQVYVGYFF